MGKRGQRRDKYQDDAPKKFRSESRGFDRDEEREPVSKIQLEPRTVNQKNYLHTIRKSVITICKGPSGSGKTLLPVGFALQNLMSTNPMYEKLIIIRSTKEACGEEMGFLPGSIDEKFIPWMGPVLDNLRTFISDGAIQCLLRHKKLEALPLAYARGRSLNNCFIILDEAQNCTPEQVLMILTRIGEDSKLVLNGDPMQSDLGPGVKSGLEDAMQRLSTMSGVGTCCLDHNDIVRNPLIAEILYHYGKLEFPPTHMGNHDDDDDDDHDHIS